MAQQVLHYRQFYTAFHEVRGERMAQKMDATLASHTALFLRAVRVLPLSERLLRELENYWRAQRQGKAGHDIPWLFLGKKTGESMDRCVGANIYLAPLPLRTLNCIRARSMSLVLSSVASEIRSPQA